MQTNLKTSIKAVRKKLRQHTTDNDNKTKLREELKQLKKALKTS